MNNTVFWEDLTVVLLQNVLSLDYFLLVGKFSEFRKKIKWRKNLHVNEGYKTYLYSMHAM